MSVTKRQHRLFNPCKKKFDAFENHESLEHSKTHQGARLQKTLHIICVSLNNKSTLYYASFFKKGFVSFRNPAPRSKIPDGSCK